MKTSKVKKTKDVPIVLTEDQESEIRSAAIPIFMRLKVLELLGLSAFVFGPYYYGRLFYYLTSLIRSNWFITWAVGLMALFITVIVLYLIYLLVGRAWLVPNWNWAKRIATKKLGYKK